MSQPEFLEATPTLVAGVVKWKLCNKITGQCDSTPPYKNARADLGYNTKDHLFVIQVVDDHTGKDIVFSQDPLWIQPSIKPTQHVIEPSAQIKQVGPGGGKVFTFQDENQGNGMVLKYQLNFQDMAGNGVTSIDPDIKNGGGSTHYSFTLIELVGFGVALLFVGFLLRPALMRLFGR